MQDKMTTEGLAEAAAFSANTRTVQEAIGRAFLLNQLEVPVEVRNKIHLISVREDVFHGTPEVSAEIERIGHELGQRVIESRSRW